MTRLNRGGGWSSPKGACSPEWRWERTWLHTAVPTCSRARPKNKNAWVSARSHFVSRTFVRNLQCANGQQICCCFCHVQTCCVFLLCTYLEFACRLYLAHRRNRNGWMEEIKGHPSPCTTNVFFFFFFFREMDSTRWGGLQENILIPLCSK